MRTRKKLRAEFEAAALPHLSDLYGVAMRYTRQPADAHDLVQETVLRAYAAWDRFISRLELPRLAAEILTNSFINGYRRSRSRRAFGQRSEEEQVVALYGEDIPSPEDELLDDALGDEVSGALAELSDEYRVVVVLADLEGLKYKDVAAVLECPVGTVMSRLFRARRQLEEKLAGFAATEYGIARAA